MTVEKKKLNHVFTSHDKMCDKQKKLNCFTTDGFAILFFQIFLWFRWLDGLKLANLRIQKKKVDSEY